MLGAGLLTALLLAAPASAQEVVDWADAASCVGRVCSVRGTVIAQENRGPVYRLYFDAARRDVYATLVRGWLVTWPNYVGHPILATGKVDRFRDSVEVMVRDPGAIDVLDAPQTPTLAPFTVAPPPAVPPTATPALAPPALAPPALAPPALAPPAPTAPPTIAAPPLSAPPPVAPAAAAVPAVVAPVPAAVPPVLVPPPAAPPTPAPAAAQAPPAATTPTPSDELERLRQRVRELEKRVEELERRKQ